MVFEPQNSHLLVFEEGSIASRAIRDSSPNMLFFPGKKVSPAAQSVGQNDRFGADISNVRMQMKAILAFFYASDVRVFNRNPQRGHLAKQIRGQFRS